MSVCISVAKAGSVFLRSNGRNRSVTGEPAQQTEVTGSLKSVDALRDIVRC